MKNASISELKARLSAYLDVVRRGDEVLITDRGRPIARITAVTGTELQDGRRDLLIRAGRLKAPTARLPKGYWQRPRPDDPEGRSVAALLEDRDLGW
jgi:prevent-host-death family protein